MPTSITDLFPDQPQVKPPAGTPPPEPQKPGQSIDSVYADIAKAQPPSAMKRAAEKIKPAAETARSAMGSAGTAMLKPYLDDYIATVNSYHASLEADAKYVPEGTIDTLKYLGRKINDLLGYYSSPVISPIYTGVVNPIKAGIQRMETLVTKHVADATYDAAKQREGTPYPKGAKGFAFNTEDVKRTSEMLQAATEGLVNAGLAFVGPKEVPKMPERDVVATRGALRDIETAAKPPEPKLTPVSVGIDKSMGFQKVNEVVGKELQGLPAGSTRSAAAVVDSMLPHAEGYAKSFLTKLSEHVNTSTAVRFVPKDGLPAHQNGIYIPAYNRVVLRLDNQNIVRTAVHEIVHSASINMLDTLLETDLRGAAEEAGRPLTASEKLRTLNNPRSPILKELDAVIREAKIRAQKAGRLGERNVGYGVLGNAFRGRDAHAGSIRDIATNRMSPRYEFVAELFSNPVFQEFLANSEKYASAGYKWKNMLNQMGNLIGRHLGMDKPHELQLLNQSMRVGSQLMKMQTVEKPPGMRDLGSIIASLDDGGSITRGDIKEVTQVGDLVNKQQVRKAGESLKITLEQLIRGISPETLGQRAKLAAAAVASRITERMQAESAWRFGSATRLKFWRARPDFAKEFIDKFERGVAFSDPVLQRLADKYREWGQRIAENDKKLGFEYEPRENYLSHIFEDQEGVAAYFMKKYGSKWGDPGFIKDRSFDLYKEAEAAGFTPRFKNPEDIMLARQHASDIAEMHIGIMEDLEKYGLAVRRVADKEELVKTVDAEGKVSLSVKKTKGTSRPENSARWRAPNGEVFWVDPHADQILQNAFKSYSLWADKGGAGTLFKGAMALKNTLVPIRLALSLFHPLHVMGIDISAGMTRAMSGMLSGSTSVTKGLKEMLVSGSMFRPISEMPGIRRMTKPMGWELMEAWRGRIPAEKISAETAAALKTLIEMGIAPEMSSAYRTNARQNFMNALTDAQASFRQRKPGSLAGDSLRTAWHLPWALVSAMQKPIFEDWIPALKAASAIRDAKNLMQRNPELADNDAARHLAMRKLGKSVENRYGEMNYSSLFWKRWIKDVSVLNTLSLGWQLGFIREYGGGALDLGQWSMKGDKVQRIREGQLDRALFVANYTALGAGVSGLMTWAFTGSPPTELLDYISPRTGEQNADGTPQRVNTMFYSREFASLYKHMENEGVVSGLKELVVNKGSGLIGLMHEWATGINAWGEHIRDPDADAFTKLEQTLAYSLSDLEPISMKAIQQSVSDQPLKQGTLTVLGFTPAPKYLTESKTTASIKQSFRSYVTPKETPYERAEYSREYTQLREAYQTGSDRYGEMLDSMSDKYELSGKDQRRLIKSLNSPLTAEQRMFMRLPWQEQVKILNKAEPDEVANLLPHANREHVRNSWEPPQ